MAQATFYTLDDITDEQANTFVCSLVYGLMQQRQRILLLCETQAQAEDLDELLWQQPTQAFIPHNLLGEGPAQGTPVLIAWLPLEQPVGHRTAVINLSHAPIADALKYRSLIELVPVETQARQRAREHYKFYRQQGMQLQNLVARLNVEGHHG